MENLKGTHPEDKIPTIEEEEVYPLATYALTPNVICNRCKYPFRRQIRSISCRGCCRAVYGFGCVMWDEVALQQKTKVSISPIRMHCIFDAWNVREEKQNYGRVMLQHIVSQPGWTARILTKHAEIQKDFDLIREYRDRVQIGLIIPATPNHATMMELLDPGTSSIRERLAALEKAGLMGLRTYVVLGPFLPGMAEHPRQIDELIRIAYNVRAEDIFVGTINYQNYGLRILRNTLAKRGYSYEAAAIQEISFREGWSNFTVNILRMVQTAIRTYGNVSKLKFLVHGNHLTPEAFQRVKEDDAGVLWLSHNNC